MTRKVRRTFALTALLLAAAGACCLFFWKTGFRQDDDLARRSDEIVIANSLAPISAPFFVSYTGRDWDEEGLRVTTHDFVEAKMCFDAVLAGQADLGNVAETPATLAAMQGKRFTLFATFVTSTKHIRLVARADRGIREPKDLVGRTVAVAVGTAGEFYKDKFLAVHGLKRADLKAVNLKPPSIVQAIVSGQVDVAVTWEPHIAEIEKQLGDKARVFPAGDYYTMTSNLVCLPEFLEKHPERAEKVLRVLARTIDGMGGRRTESIEIVARKLNVSPEIVEPTWDNYQFGLSLDPLLIESMNEQARWAIDSGLAKPGTPIPDFRHWINSAPLGDAVPRRDNHPPRSRQ